MNAPCNGLISYIRLAMWVLINIKINYPLYTINIIAWGWCCSDFWDFERERAISIIYAHSLKHMLTTFVQRDDNFISNYRVNFWTYTHIHIYMRMYMYTRYSQSRMLICKSLSLHMETYQALFTDRLLLTLNRDLLSVLKLQRPFNLTGMKCLWTYIYIQTF